MVLIIKATIIDHITDHINLHSTQADTTDTTELMDTTTTGIQLGNTML